MAGVAGARLDRGPQLSTESRIDNSHLVVIDPQRIFADADSLWGAPSFAEAFSKIQHLAGSFDSRVTVTRWLPTADRSGSWGDYFAEWPFADRPADDPLFDLVPGASVLSAAPSIDLGTFGKWGPELGHRLGEVRNVVLTGVSTDCCVLSTALAMADAGLWVTVVADACAASSDDAGTAALQVMSLYSPQITVVTSTDLG